MADVFDERAEAAPPGGGPGHTPGAALTPAMFSILLALADGERHGYSILREVERYGDGRARLGPTTLYRSIKQMLAAGLIEELDERPDPALDDERRRYYRLTATGRAAATSEAARMQRLLAVAQAKQLAQGQVLPGTALGGA